MYPPFENSTTRIAISKHNTSFYRLSDEQQTLERVKEATFKIFDKNGDGFISVDEVNKLKESFSAIQDDKIKVRNIWFSDPLAPSK